MKNSFTTNLELGLDHLHKSGAFLTVKNNDKVNTMTISWGSIGFEWQRPTFTVLVRKSRYTHEFLDNSNEFTVSVPTDDSFKNALALCGTKSGRNIDKFKECNLKTIDGKFVSVPVISGCGVCYECKVVYSQDLDVSRFPKEIQNSAYPDEDIHTLYFAEIVNTYSTK